MIKGVHRNSCIQSAAVGIVPLWLAIFSACLSLAGVVGRAASAPDKSGVKPSAISLPSGAGSIEGLGESFEPQLNTGGSSYGVSISLPPGRAGLAPSVRLSYNSYAGNGLCGIGWALEFPDIKRQTDKGFPEYDEGDTFVFGGEELVPLNNVGKDWRCENERSFQRLRRIDSNGDGLPDAWEVTERNGTRHTFGRFRGQNNRWSVVEHPEKSGLSPFDRTYQWLLDSTTDVHGNRVEYEYVQGAGVLYPSRITYAHLGNNFHEVTFAYQVRPDQFDDYRPSFARLLDRRLTRVEVRSQGQLVRAYNLAYGYEPGDLTPAEATAQASYLDLGVTLLKRVVQVDRSGSDANYLPPLVFTYSGLDLTRAELRGFTAPPGLDLSEPNGRVQLADLDGDSLPDLLATTFEGATLVQRASLNRGESRVSGQLKLTFAPAKLVVGSSPVDLAQVNTVIHDPKGKGLVDMSSLVDDGGNKRLETFLNRARLDLVDEDRLGFTLENLESTVIPNPPAFVSYSATGTRQMDVNFDKRGDFVNLEPGFGGMKVNTFFLQRNGTWVASESTLPASYPLANTFQGPNGEPNAAVQVADMNGDRMMDLIALSPSPGGGGQRLRVSYWPLTGRGRYGEERVMATTEPDTLDIGTADLRDVFLEDITGDGLTDLLVLDGSGPETVLTLRVNLAGKGWSPPYTRGGLPRYAPRDPAAPTVLRLADLNGNGSTDLLFRNTVPQDSWAYVELLPRGAPSLMAGIDNGLGKRTAIVYGSASEDERLAREAGYPWRTFAPVALQVVRQIRVSAGVDLNGDGREDTAVLEFRYRDPYYDGFEREFRGFAFAQRIDYGDDFLFDPVTGLMNVSPGWNTSRTPTGQKSGPSLVTRYRFYTGAADQKDNDVYDGSPPPDAKIDEITEVGGREEEPLKGLQLVEEKVDPVVLHAAPDGGFDAGCTAAAVATTPGAQTQLTPDAYVYTRVRQEWTVRRLYRPTEALPYIADQNANGLFEDYRNSPAVPVPAGRFGSQGISVLDGNGRSVSFVFASRQTTEVIEANGLLSVALGYAAVSPGRTSRAMDYDDFGNPTSVREFGFDDPAFDDERVTTTTYALGGNALSLWIINKPDTVSVTDENGVFVARKEHYYDGDPFVGVQGQIQGRALLHRTLDYIDPTHAVQSSRARFDGYGNTVETRDPRGNARWIDFDPQFQLYPVRETLVVGGGSPDLVLEADYDPGFGVVTLSRDFNGNVTRYGYDGFARPVSTVRPGDTEAFPTLVYEYQPCDPIRGRGYVYDPAGNLTVIAVPPGAVSRVTTRSREAAGLPGQFITATYTDGGGRALAAVEEGEAAGTWVVKQATSYNLRGQPQSQWLPFRVASLEIPQFPAVWPAGRPPELDGTNLIVSTDLFYDPLGRQIRSLSPPESVGGERRQTAMHNLPFQGWTLDEEDLNPASPHAGTPHIAYSDGLGRVIGVTEAVRLDDQGKPAAVTNLWLTRYAYDLNDQLVQITDAQNNVKTMRFDGLKRKTSMNDPDQGETLFSYDDASNLVETRDAKGQRITYTYDGLNRILTEDYVDEGSAEFSYHRSPDVTYHYDLPAGPVDQGDGTTQVARNTKGMLASVEDTSGEEHTSYDERGRTEWTSKLIPDPGSNLPLTPLPSELVSYTTRFSYDSLDRVVRMQYPDNDEVSYGYNARNLLQRIQGGPTGGIISSIDYSASGQTRQIEYGNGVRTTYAYDPRLRLSDLLTVSQPATLNRELIRFHYEFDGVSNIRAIEDRRSASTLSATDKRRNSQTFTYDDLYRLTRVQYNVPAAASVNGGEVNYRYDRIGNMLAQSSDITQLEKGFSVTDLGTMSYGGAGGAANRNGRPSGAPPGPHALTGMQHPQTGTRPFPYDANGNMTQIDGLRCTWDFKDRLVGVEDDTMRAEYRYDYSDRRIIKRVWPKAGTNAPPAAPKPQASAVVYPGQHFEMREHDAPTKYVFDGATRVARITGSLSGNSRVQRLRLNAGWNLMSLAIAVPFAVRRMNLLDPVFRWDRQTLSWAEVFPDETVSAGTVLWVHARTNTLIALSGAYVEPTNELVPAGGGFYPGAGLEVWDLGASLGSQPSLTAWRFGSRDQAWSPQQPSLAGSDTGVPEVLAPGAAVFVAAPAGVELQMPRSALRIRYYHQDHLGSSAVITDANGEPLEEIAYYPFGTVRAEQRIFDAREPFSFAQKERDAESGLDYFEARFRSGVYGRFISVDPKYANVDKLSGDDFAALLSSPQQLHLYAYVANNPIRYTDPRGLGIVDDVLGAANDAITEVVRPMNDPDYEIDWKATAEWPIRATLEMVGDFIGINTANAPGPGTKTYPSLSYGEHAKNIARDMTAGKVASFVGGKLLGRPTAAEGEAVVAGAKGAPAVSREPLAYAKTQPTIQVPGRARAVTLPGVTPFKQSAGLTKEGWVGETCRANGPSVDAVWRNNPLNVGDATAKKTMNSTLEMADKIFGPDHLPGD